MSWLSSALRAGSKALGGAVEKASGGLIPARVLTIPKSASGEPLPSSSSNVPMQTTQGPFVGGQPLLQTSPGTFEARWSTFLLLVVFGMLLGMVWRKKY